MHVLGGIDGHEVYPPPPLPASVRDVLVTPVSLPLSWSWIRGDRGDSQLVYSPPPGNKFPDKVWATPPSPSSTRSPLPHYMLTGIGNIFLFPFIHCPVFIFGTQKHVSVSNVWYLETETRLRFQMESLEMEMCFSFQCFTFGNHSNRNYS